MRRGRVQISVKVVYYIILKVFSFEKKNSYCIFIINSWNTMPLGVMIRSQISFTQECGVVLKLEIFSHLSGRSFEFGSPIELDALSLML